MREAQLTRRCDDCGGSMRLHLSQFVFHGGIEWSIHSQCDDCGADMYECGRDDTPEPLRAALIGQCGIAH